MNEPKFKLDDLPLIVRLVLFILPLGMWVGNLHSQSAANTNEIAEMKSYLAKRRDVGDNVLARLSAIEAKLDIIMKRVR